MVVRILQVTNKSFHCSIYLTNKIIYIILIHSSKVATHSNVPIKLTPSVLDHLSQCDWLVIEALQSIKIKMEMSGDYHLQSTDQETLPFF